MINIFYVYMLLDPRKSDSPFYVGKGKGNRYKVHLSETLDNTCNKRKVGYIRNIRKEGFEPNVILYSENLSESCAFEIEIELIAKYGRKGFDEDGILMNITKGGDGGPTLIGKDNPIFGTKRPQHVKDAISKANKGKTPWNKGIERTEEVKLAISKANKGRKDPYKGKTRSEQAKKNMREGWKKFKDNNPDHKFKGFSKECHSEETKKKISEANKGQIPWNKGIPMTEEAKKKALTTKRKRGLIK